MRREGRQVCAIRRVQRPEHGAQLPVYAPDPLSSLAKALRPICHVEALNLVWPLSPAAIASVSELPRARGAALVADGGGDFFSRFLKWSGHRREGSLDAFTEHVFRERVEPRLREQGIPARFFFPFFESEPRIDFQKLGRSVGLGTPGPLGIQVHPRYGPWWAYRALVLADIEAEEESPVGDGCAGCPAPCVSACHGGAVSLGVFNFVRCDSTKAVEPRCVDRCDARLACIRGTEHRYGETQMRFHQHACKVSVVASAPR